MDYSLILCDTALNSGNTICLTADGLSMWPVITGGMKAEIAPLASGAPEKGSLILTSKDGGLVVHRCWGVTCQDGVTLVVTKGDTNLGFDAPVTIDKVLGKVVCLRNRHDAVRDPNRGFLRFFGLVICASGLTARIWARICRVLLRLMGRL